MFQMHLWKARVFRNEKLITKGHGNLSLYICMKIDCTYPVVVMLINASHIPAPVPLKKSFGKSSLLSPFSCDRKGHLAVRGKSIVYLNNIRLTHEKNENAFKKW